MLVGEDDRAGQHTRRLKHPAEHRERVAEVVTAGIQVRFRPQEIEESIARPGGSARSGVEGEVGEQRRGLLGAEAGDDLLRTLHCQPTQ